MTIPQGAYTAGNSGNPAAANDDDWWAQNSDNGNGTSGTYVLNANTYNATDTITTSNPGTSTSSTAPGNTTLGTNVTLNASGTAAAATSNHAIGYFQKPSSATANIFTMTGNAVVKAEGNDGATSKTGYGIFLFANSDDVTYAQGGNSTVTATGTSTGSGKGIGIQVNSSSTNATYEQSGNSTVIATGISNGSGGGYGINVVAASTGTASYKLDGGTLTLKPDTTLNGKGIAVHARSISSSTASFAAGTVLTPVIDMQTNSVGKMQIATMVSSGATATIAVGAILRPDVTNTIALAAGQKIGGTFLQTVTEDMSSGLTITGYQNGISGHFDLDSTNLASTPTLQFEYDYTDASQHKIFVTRVASVSNNVIAAKGANQNLAKALEENAAFLATTEGKAYSDFYSSLDNSSSVAEVNKKLRAANNANATRLTHQALMNVDRVQKELFRGMRGVAGAGMNPTAMNAPIVLASSDPAYSLGGGRANGSNVWLTPIFSWDRYDAANANYDKTDGYTAGLSGGVARQTAYGTVGIGLSYLYSKQQGGHYNAESDNFSIMAGYVSNPLSLSSAFAPQLEAAIGYTYSNVDQDRRDFTGKKQTSSPDMNSGRLYLGMAQTILSDNGALAMTPRFGLDYTHISLDSASEGNGGLYTGGKDIDSLRPRLGADFYYALSDRLGLTASAYARYETMDNNVNLDTRFNGTPIIWQTDGENRDRASGELGIGMTYQYSDTFTIDARYNLTVANDYNSNQASLNLNWRF